MSFPTTMQGDVFVQGNLACQSFSPPEASITDAAIQPAAGLAATKLEHQHRKTYAQESATTAASESRVIHAVRGVSATIIGFCAGNVVANIGDSTVTVDLLKNGTTVLTAPISLDSGDIAYALVAGALASTSLVAGDVLEVALTATLGTGTLAKGAFCELTVHEDAV